MCRNVGSDPTSLSTRPATPLSCVRVRGPNHLHHGEDHRRGCKSESSFKLPGSRRLHATAGLQIFFFEVWRGEAEGWKERSSVCLTDTVLEPSTQVLLTTWRMPRDRQLSWVADVSQETAPYKTQPAYLLWPCRGSSLHAELQVVSNRTVPAGSSTSASWKLSKLNWTKP